MPIALLKNIASKSRSTKGLGVSIGEIDEHIPTVTPDTAVM